MLSYHNTPDVLRSLIESPHPITVVVDEGWRTLWETRFDDPLSDAETLRLDAEGRIIEIGKSPKSFEEIEAQYIGSMRFQGNGVSILRDAYVSLGATPRPWMKARSVQTAYMTDLLMEIVLLGHDVHAVRICGGWLEVDTVRDYETYASLFNSGAITALFNPVA